MEGSVTERVTPGPCVAWVTGAEVGAACNAQGSDAAAYETAATEASQLLFELSGRLYTGGCVATVRPCRQGCSCWDGLVSAGDFGWAAWPGYGWGWWGGAGCGGAPCGCGTLAEVVLAGYPIVSVDEVKIDGDPLGPDEFRLDRNRYLVRLADTDGNPQLWPACQQLDLPDSAPGTWSITYTYGTAPPQAGIDAAAQLGCALYKSFHGQDCGLPQGATRVTRQGVTIERGLLASFLRPGQTGLPLVDAFLAAYNPTGARRRPAVMSPELANRFPYPAG